MDGQVEHDWDPGHRGVANELCVAEEGGSTVMVGVEESQRLLAQHEEERVSEFEIFRQVVEVVESGQGWRETTVAAGVVAEAS